MAIGAMFEVNGAAAAKYDEVIRRLTAIGQLVPAGRSTTSATATNSACR